MQKILKFTCLIFFSCLCCAAAAADTESLLVFVQPERDPVSPTFRDDVSALAVEQNVNVEFIDISGSGAPPEVTITPTIVFQNFRGRSIYQGRTTTVDRIRNFIRTSRYVRQGEKPNTRTKIPIWSMGRTRIWSPLKISAVTGAVPDDYEHDRFEREAREAIERGFDSFEIDDSAELGRTDRGFYMDFYPWLSNDGTLFLSLALYSQFHCKTPVFECKSEPLTGPWRKRKKLFRRAAKILEDAVANAIASAEDGDGFVPVPVSTPVRTWEDLGFSLPAAPVRSTGATGTVPAAIPSEWILNSAEDSLGPPMIQFRFPAPLDQYTGMATQGSAKLTIPQAASDQQPGGFFEIDPRSVSMGETDLDSALQGSLFLNTKKYPFARFVISSFDTGGELPAYGQLLPVDVSGTFLLKGHEIPLKPRMELEPVVDSEGKPQMIVQGSFGLNLRDFGIEGADGPEPEKHTLLLDFYFQLSPAKKGDAK